MRRALCLVPFLAACSDDPATSSDAGSPRADASVSADAAQRADAAASADAAATPDAGAGGAIPIGDLPAAVARSLCEGLFRCRSPGVDSVSARLYFVDAATCVAQLLHQPGAGSRVLADMIRDANAGRVIYDGQAAADCLARYDGRCTYALAGLDPAQICPDMFVGTATRGASCRFSHECDPSLFCGGDQCPGACAPRLALGELCNSDVECALPAEPGAYANCGSTCEHRRPGAGPASAELGPCGYPVGTSLLVLTSTECQSGLYCGRNGQCHAPIAAGGACLDDDWLCEGAAFCERDTGGMQRCRAITRGALGDPCPQDTPDFCDLSAGLICGTANRCVSAGDGTLGAPCERDAPTKFDTCARGFFCGPGATCVARVADGQSCDKDEECVSGACRCVDLDCLSQTCSPRGCE